MKPQTIGQRISSGLGTYAFLRGKGAWYIDVARGWIAPAGVAGGLTKYLGADTTWSLAVAVAIPVGIEVGGFLLGRFLYAHGGIFRDYELALSRDPYRSESLELFRRIAADLQEIKRQLVTLGGALPR